jgi:hypothetical protein
MGTMTRRGVLALVAAIGLATTFAAAAPVPVTSGWLLDQVKALSAPEMEGRESGTPGGDRSAEYIEKALRATGLRPAGEAGDYRMTPFPVPTRVRLGADNLLTLVAPSGRSFALGTDWTPTGGSIDGVTEGSLVFVGYGISASELGYDDYAGLDVRGKIVIAMAGEPRRRDRSSPFARTHTASYGQRVYKARLARERGARALLLVARPEAGPDTLPPVRNAHGAGDLVSAAITRATAEALLEAAGYALQDLREHIEASLTPASRQLPGVRVRLRVQLLRDTGSGVNLVGILPGSDPTLAREAVVVGAHYDHLGRSGNGSLDAHGAAIHPGADDNASGTAAVLALARGFAASSGTPRTLVFALFAGEELGLLGAEAYLRQPPVPLERTIAMVNLDMVGRLRANRLQVGGLDSARGLEKIVTAAAEGLGLDLTLLRSPYAPSDHASFYEHRMPVLFFHTGGHEDYHRTTDTWEKVNAAGLERVVLLAGRIIDRLARDEAPRYVRLERERTAPSAVGSAAGTASYFGISPDFADEDPGVRLALVQTASPADRAGIRKGDVVVRFGGVRVYTFDDLRDAIGERKPGDAVEVVYLRDGQERTVQATLGVRR